MRRSGPVLLPALATLMLATVPLAGSATAREMPTTATTAPAAARKANVVILATGTLAAW